MTKMDFHIHSSYSSDCSTSIAAIVSEAIRAGIDAIGVVDHVRGSAKWMTERDRDIQILREKHAQEITILSGIEVKVSGYDGRLDIDDDTASMADFVVASFHGVPNDVARESSSRGDEAVIQWWHRCMRRLLEEGQADVIGHPDRILSLRNIALQSGSTEDLLDSAEKSPTFLEWNAASLYPRQPFVNALARRGAPNIVFASDAHSVDEMARSYETLTGFESQAVEKGNASFFDLLTRRRSG